MGHGLKDYLTWRGNKEMRLEGELPYENWLKAIPRGTKISYTVLPSFPLQTPPKMATSKGGEHADATAR